MLNHAITIRDVLIISGIALVPICILGALFWVLSRTDFSK